jgi:hypothetical protein
MFCAVRSIYAHMITVAVVLCLFIVPTGQSLSHGNEFLILAERYEQASSLGSNEEGSAQLGYHHPSGETDRNHPSGAEDHCFGYGLVTADPLKLLLVVKDSQRAINLVFFGSARYTLKRPPRISA